jgi:acyl carrier protein
MSNAHDLHGRIEQIFVTKLNVEIPSPDTDLIDKGILDSLKFVDLLLHLEHEFNRKISLDNLEIDNFRSVRKIATDSNVFACMGKSRAAAVHILGAHQEDLAKKFLSTTKLGTGMLNGEPFTDGKTNSLILQNAPAYVECTVRHIIDSGGDHGIVILEVIEAEYRMDAPPLLIAGTHWHYGG